MGMQSIDVIWRKARGIRHGWVNLKRVPIAVSLPQLYVGQHNPPRYTYTQPHLIPPTYRLPEQTNETTHAEIYIESQQL